MSSLRQVDARIKREQYYFFLFLLFALSFFLTSCVSAPLQSDLLLSEPSLQPRQHEIKDVPYVKQSDNHCGPATLSMVMQYWGEHAHTNDQLNDLTKQTYTSDAKGSFQTDMISAARRHGYMAVPIEGMKALLDEVTAGHPVIIFENLGLNWLPQWHYAVVYGFNLNKKKILMHSGPKPHTTEDIKDFERSWQLGNYWGLVVMRPGHFAVSANEFQNVSAAAALESLHFFESAERSYQSILQRWPNSLIALIGMGNLMYRQGRLSKALDYFEEAAFYHPSSPAAQHNYVVLEQEIKKTR